MSATSNEVALWDAINRYAVSVGGDPSRHVYGNATRMQAVVDVGVAISKLDGESRPQQGANSVPFRELLETMQHFATDNPNHEVLDRQVIVRLNVEDDDVLHVGGLQSVTVDAGCTDHFALVLDADQERPPADDLNANQEPTCPKGSDHL